MFMWAYRGFLTFLNMSLEKLHINNVINTHTCDLMDNLDTLFSTAAHRVSTDIGGRQIR